MRLEFQRRHLSIAAFPTIDLPPLTITVGVNGSGKTHLLEAIQHGAVQNTVSPVVSHRGAPMPPSIMSNDGPIRLLSNSGLSRLMTSGVGLPQHGGPIAETTYETPKGPANPEILEASSRGFERVRQMLLQPYVAPLGEALGIEVSSIIREGEDPWRLGASELLRCAERGERSGEVLSVFDLATEAMLTADMLKFGDSSDAAESAGHFRLVPIVADKLNTPVLNVTRTQIDQFQTWNANQFNFDMATLFGRYRDRLLRNRLKTLADQENGTDDALSKEGFERAYGRPPWVSLNETFLAFGLPYEVITPELWDYSQYRFGLRKIGSGDEVQPSNLSSGERVLLQFAISTYNVDDGLTNINRPKLLLLDELDAPLHPEMVHRWLRAISDGLVGEQGIHCILTTHSPTTVALAPEAALYEMRDGVSGLTKVTKQEALNKLTFGVPTLSINYSGRRQVFTESDTDAPIYEGVYALIKSHMKCERELNFLSTGLRDKNNGEINAGCTIVKQTVERLTELGNLSIYGIIDWDGEAVSSDRIKVVAEGERDGIENVLLDPLLVALLLMKERKLPEGLEDIDRFTGASSLAAFDLQRLIDAIQIPLFPEATERVEVSYIGGAKGNVFREYLIADDHDLEEALCAKFDGLKQWHPRGKGRGTLVKIVVEHVLAEHTGFCPVALPTVFEAIANAPS